jgi:stage III sporulation protein AB
MRILGGVIFLIGTVGFGITQAFSYENRTEALRQITDMMQYLIAQIRIENASLPDSICKVSVRMDGTIGEILQNIQKCNLENDGKPLFEIWQKEMMAMEEILDEKELELLVHMFDQTGFYDSKTQLQRLQMNLEIFTEEIKTREEQRENRCRLYQSMGLLAGIFVIILLW